MSTLSLNCFILGRNPSTSFTVEILKTESVSQLGKLIKSKLPNRLKRVDASHLTVWRDAKNCSLRRRSLRFFGGEVLEDEQVHVLVQVPTGTSSKVNQPVEVHNPMQLLSVICLILGTKLRSLIKTEHPNCLNHVDAPRLTVWKVSLPVDAVTPKLTIDDVEGCQKLQPLEKMSSIFGEALVREYVHILVQAPTSILRDKRTHDMNDDGPPPEVKRLKMDIADAPSTLAFAYRFKKIVGPKCGIALNRPFEPFTIPLVLLHEAFGSFKDRCERPPSERALICLGELVLAACEWHGYEVSRRTAIESILANHMGLQFHEQKIPGAEYFTDGNFAITIMPAAIRGCKKNEHGEALNQVILYYAHFLSNVLDDFRHIYNLNTRFPSILMVDMGVYFGFYGAVWDGTRVRVEPLTPLFDLSTHLREINTRFAMAATLDALRVAVDSINAHYNLIEAKAKANPILPKAYDPDLQKARGYPFLTSYKDKDDEQEIHFMHSERLHAEKLIFRAAIVNQPESDPLLSTSRRTPRLRQCVRISAHWIGVIMDESKYEMLFGLSLSGAEREKVRHKVMSAVRILHQEGFVHGDIRQSNNLIDVESLATDDVRIHLIDLDWAGPIGAAKYPADLNRITMRRPEGVEGGGLITEQHDIDMASLFLFA
ncbi:hypothetical protein AMATHDRAFT_42357 [Amanita thiersii Skay4041]|uniref:Protein kinase domain-containing protein n=1 Tax=Amanita thiersii Skay4041 TaxID=703135 RepID=A0A2A9NE27_9AGAR|nr:hypothetical protein AMATHDRAFT_42357 [Amanita thiersii Skay4041]